jgi:hypothetical protein
MGQDVNRKDGVGDARSDKLLQISLRKRETCAEEVAVCLPLKVEGA